MEGNKVEERNHDLWRSANPFESDIGTFPLLILGTNQKMFSYLQIYNKKNGGIFLIRERESDQALPARKGTARSKQQGGNNEVLDQITTHPQQQAPKTMTEASAGRARLAPIDVPYRWWAIVDPKTDPGVVSAQKR